MPTQGQAIFSLFSRSFPLSGLTVYIQREQHLCIALVELEQAGALLDLEHAPLLELLSVEEQEYFKRFSYPKRRNEWLGGRIAAKMAMNGLAEYNLSPKNLRQITIMPDELGRPKANRLTDQGLSISHSSGFAVALAANRPCGIDLQKISSRLPKLIDRFALEQEIATLAALNTIEHTTLLTIIWAAKEAIKKSMLSDQPGIFGGIEILQVTAAGSNAYRLLCNVRGNLQQTVNVYDFSPYILALTGAAHA